MAPAAHEPVVDLLDQEWGAVIGLGRELGETEWDMPSECPGWSVRDLLSHMIGTERGLLGTPPPTTLAEVPAHVHNETGARNEAWVAARRSVPGRDLVDEFADVTAQRLAQLRSWPAQRFDQVGPSPVGEAPYREFMRVRVMDCWIHEQDMRVATGRPGHDRGAVAELALDRLTAALPFVVGKQVGAPEGSAVRVELRGPRHLRFDVAVRAGRASVVSDLEGEPSAVVDMDTEAFWRLACGRVPGPAARAAGLVTVRGDEALGARVVDAMAFMI